MPHLTNRSWLPMAIVLAMVIASLTFLTGCTRTAEKPSLPAPAASVQQLLELRSANSTDTARYMRHIESTALAQTLANDSATRKKGETPTPTWNTPSVSKETTSSAEVMVEWKPSEKFKQWPDATLFKLRRIDGRWLVIDAVDTSATAR